MTLVLEPEQLRQVAVRLVKVVRRRGRHELRDLTVDVALEGDFDAAHNDGDNTGLLATDTMRNTVYALRQGTTSSRRSRRFARALAEHFVAAGPRVDAARGCGSWSTRGPGCGAARARLPARQRRHASPS